MRASGGGFVGSAGGKDAARSKDVKKQRCKANINNKLAICHPELVSGSQEMQSRRGQSDVQHDINYEKRTYRPNVLPSYRLKKCAFTLAEMMVVMLILSIIMAAMAPVMTTRNKLDQSSPWQWASNGSDAYYALGDAQVAMLGQERAENTDTSSRLVINAPEGKDHILFKTGDTVLGSIKFKNDGLLLGSLLNGDLVTNSVAVGRNTSVGGSNSTAIGINSSATNTDTTAIGSGSSATNYYSTAIGTNAKASGGSANAFGKDAQALGNSSNAIGYNAKSSDQVSNAIGNYAEASGVGATAIGDNSEASMEGSTALGRTSKATAIHSTAIGNQSEASAQYSNAIGDQSKATANYSNAIGYKAEATLYSALSIGQEAISSGNSSIAIGNSADALASNAISIGSNAETSDMSAIAIGSYSSALDYGSIAIGGSAEASEIGSIAIGNNTKALGYNNISIGSNACNGVTGSSKVCIGAFSGPGSNIRGMFPGILSDTKKVIFLGDANTTVFVPGVLRVGDDLSDSYFSSNVGKNRSDWQGALWVNMPSTYIGGQRANGWLTMTNNDDAHITTHLVSDRRLKYVGKESTSGLDKIRQLKVFNYTFKKDEKKTPHVGVIAQDLQKVFPDAVKKGVDGFLTIRFEDMFFAMINAIKELDTRVTTLQKENQQLTELLKQVKDDNKELNAVLKQVQNDNKKLDARLKAIEAKIK